MILNVSNAQVGTISTGINVQLNYGKLSTGLGLNLGGEYFISERYAVRLNSSFMFSHLTVRNTLPAILLHLSALKGLHFITLKKKQFSPMPV